MALTKKTVYILLLFATCILYFLYSISNSIDGNFYRLAPRFIGGNASQPSALQSKLSDLKNPNNITTVEEKVNATLDVQVPLKTKVEPSPVPVKPAVAVSESPKKVASVIQHIASKPESKGNDYIVNGVLTETLYESGFIHPSVEICPDYGKEFAALIVVTSAPKHDLARMAIRQTWGHFHQRSDVAVAFLIGKTTASDQPSIEKEVALYNDIIQSEVIDSYNNLTLKTISMLEWVENYCYKVRFVLKTDDDMFINVPKLLTFLSKHVKDKRKIYGRLAKKWKPIRNKSSKYYVSPQQYKNPVFPDFTTGPAYAFTGDIVHDLYTAALGKTYLKLEDVYMTGIVAQDKKIQRVHINEFFNRRVALNACNVQKGISIHMVKPFEQYDLWKKLLDGRSKCTK